MATYRALRTVLLLSLFTLLLGTTWVPVSAQDARTEKPVETSTPEESSEPEPTPSDTSEREQASEPRESDGADRVESPDRTGSNDRAVPSGTPSDNPDGDFQAAGELSVSFNASTYDIAPGTSAPASVTLDFVHDVSTKINIGRFFDIDYSDVVVTSGQPGSSCVVGTLAANAFNVNADAPVGTAGTCIISFTISVPSGVSAGDTFTVSALAYQPGSPQVSAYATVVTGVAPPKVVANNETYRIDEGTPSLSGTLTATGGSGTYRFEAYGFPDRGVVTISESGAFEYIPNPGAKYEDSFAFWVYDASDASLKDFGEVTIRFNKVIQPVVAPDIVVDVPFEGTVSIFIKPTGGINPNFSHYHLSIDSNVTKGEITRIDEGIGLVNYTAFPGMGGTDSFEYTATDNGANPQSDSGTVTIRIGEPSAGSFQASSLNYAVVSGMSTSGTLSATGGIKPYTYAVTQAPDWGTITAFDPATGDFTIAADPDSHDSASFEYTATDSSTTPQTSSATVTFAIDSTVILYAHPTTIGPVEPGGTVENFPLWDNAGGTGYGHVTIEISTQPTQGEATLTPDGWLTYVASPGASGTDSFTYTLTDMVGDTIAQQVTATITVIITTPRVTPSPTTTPGEVDINPGSGAGDEGGNDDNTADPGQGSSGEDVSDPRQDGSGSGEEIDDNSSGEGSGDDGVNDDDSETDPANDVETGTGDMVETDPSIDDGAEAETGSVIRLPSAGSGTSGGTAPWILAALSLSAVILVALAFGCVRSTRPETSLGLSLRDANISVTDKL